MDKVEVDSRQPRRRNWAVEAIVGCALLVLVFVYVSFRLPLRRLDPTAPFDIMLGEDSWHRQKALRVRQDGTVMFYRTRVEDLVLEVSSYERSTRRLSPEDLADVVAAVNDTGVLGLADRHEDSRVADGGRVILRVKQAGKTKLVYCDNSFPTAVGRFKTALYEILKRNDRGAAEWRPLGQDEGQEFKRDFWEGVGR